MPSSPARLAGVPFKDLVRGAPAVLCSEFGVAAVVSGLIAAASTTYWDDSASTAAVLAVVAGSIGLLSEAFTGAFSQHLAERFGRDRERTMSDADKKAAVKRWYKRQENGGLLRGGVRSALGGAAAGAGIRAVLRAPIGTLLEVGAITAIALAALRTVATERFTARKLTVRAQVHCAFCLSGDAAAQREWNKQQASLTNIWLDAISARCWLALGLSFLLGSVALNEFKDGTLELVFAVSWLLTTLLLCGTAARAAREDLDKPARPADPSLTTDLPSS